jgi:hypothetical protein
MKRIAIVFCLAASLAAGASEVFCKANGKNISDAACWGDNLAPHDDAAYVIASNHMASVVAGAIFGGKSLQVGRLPYASSKDIGKLRSLGSGTHRNCGSDPCFGVQPLVQRDRSDLARIPDPQLAQLPL